MADKGNLIEETGKYEGKLKGKLIGVDTFNDLKNDFYKTVTPVIPPLLNSELNPAEWTYERLGIYIKDFEANLDNEHEIGARLVSFGQTLTFHIENVGYYGPDIINFDGINSDGKKVQLIQHISQLSVLLVAMKKLKDKPNRIGFIWDKKEENEEP